jgi:ribosomal-protein-alanine N-acetyltransferase
MMEYNLLFRGFPVIENEEIILKKITIDDLNDLVEIYTNENLYRYKPGMPKKTNEAIENMIGHFKRDFNKKKIIFLGIYLKSQSNKLVGVAEIFDVNEKVDCVTMGYTLNENYWGKGIATKSTALLLEYLFNQIQVNRIQGFVMPENESSSKVLLRNNFLKEGTIRQGNFWTGRGIVDLELYAILKSDYSPYR